MVGCDYLELNNVRFDAIVIKTRIAAIFALEPTDCTEEQIVQPRAIRLFQLLAYK